MLPARKSASPHQNSAESGDPSGKSIRKRPPVVRNTAEDWNNSETNLLTSKKEISFTGWVGGGLEIIEYYHNVLAFRQQKICKLDRFNGYCKRKSATFPMAQKAPAYVENWTSEFRRWFTRHKNVHRTSKQRQNSTSKGLIWTSKQRPNNVAVLAGVVQLQQAVTLPLLFERRFAFAENNRF